MLLGVVKCETSQPKKPVRVPHKIPATRCSFCSPRGTARTRFVSVHLVAHWNLQKQEKKKKIKTEVKDLEKEKGKKIIKNIWISSICHFGKPWSLALLRFSLSLELHFVFVDQLRVLLCSTGSIRLAQLLCVTVSSSSCFSSFFIIIIIIFGLINAVIIDICDFSDFLFPFKFSVCLLRNGEKRRWNFESPEVSCCFSFLKLESLRVVVLGSVGNGDIGFMCNLSDQNFISFYFFRFCRFS